MCRYKSAIVLRNGDLVHSDATDSHTDLLDMAGISDTSMSPNFVRVEFTSNYLADIDTYKLRMDQDWLPDWWTPEAAEDATRKLRRICERAIVAEARKCLVGGAWVLRDGANVERIVSARVIEMWDSSRVGTMWDSSQVGTMWDSSQVGTMRDSSRVLDDKRVK